MPGYISQSETNIAGLTYDALLVCKTNIGGWFFDGFTKVEHNINLKVTENPVETGAAIVDHAYVEPATLVMDILVSDVHQSIVPGQFEGGYSRHTKAWTILKQMQADRIPVSVYTKLGQYNNMLIQSLSAIDKPENYNSLSASVTLKEIPIARVKTVKISKAAQTTIETEMAKLEAFQAVQEDISRLALLMGSNYMER